MNPAQRYERAVELFHEARELTSGDRTALLDRECTNNDELRQLVETLLENDNPTSMTTADIEPGLGINLLAQDLTQETTASNSDVAFLTESVPGYRIIQTIGQGGMGVVYEAQQENPNRRVALKVIKNASMSRQLMRRFENEAFVLGQLRHPGVAHIYESGRVEVNGRVQPFFAMELIEGERINVHADKLGLTDRQRMELMARVCDAVHHAHQKGIIHRDLKPGNILIVESGTTTHDQESRSSASIDMIGQPKILDFGIARVTDSDLQTVTMQTEVGQIVGTLAYMSPEQLAGDSQLLDTRCDVYALGVVLFQLLADRLPLDVSNQPVAEAARIIRDQDPIRLGSIKPELRGDVETVVDKSLQKEPDRRYTSAAELAADLRRFLHDEPIVARPPTTGYLLRKFAKRHKGLVSGLALAFAFLLIGLAGTGYYLVETRKQRTEAIDARITSDELLKFFLDVMSSARHREQGPSVTVVEAVRAAAETIEDRFDSRPLLAVKIHHNLSHLLSEFGELDLAMKQARLAVAKLESEDATDTEDYPLALAKLGNGLLLSGRFDESSDYLEHAYRASIEVFGPRHSETAAIAVDLASDIWFPQGRNEEAREILEDVLARRDEYRLLTVYTAELKLPNILFALGQNQEAERRLLEFATRLRSEQDQGMLATVLSRLAALYRRTGRYEEALSHLRESQALGDVVYKPKSGQRIVIRTRIGDTLRLAGKLDEALQAHDEAAAMAREYLPPQHPLHALIAKDRAHVLIKLRRFPEAERELLSAHAALESFRANPEFLRDCRQLIVFLYEESNQPAKAAEWKEPVITSGNRKP